MKTTAIVDGDLILHRAASATQQTYEWSNGAESVSASFPKAREKATDFILEYRRAVDADQVVVALSDPTGNYFRRQIYPPYKANRKGTPKPVLYTNLREWVEDAFECVWKPSLEGDDVAGILSGHAAKYPGRRIIVSVDKDMLTVPGWLYRPHRKGEGLREITVAEADRAHMIQTLTGDPGDGYCGVKGIGPKKAEKILDAATSAAIGWIPPGATAEQIRAAHWRAVVETYERAGMTEEDALVQARLAYILRFGDYHQAVGIRAWVPV
jgi:DNA polymerase-1